MDDERPRVRAATLANRLGRRWEGAMQLAEGSDVMLTDRRATVWHLAVATAFALVVLPLLARLADAQPRTEVFVGGGVATSGEGELRTSFVPILGNAVATGVAGGQQLTLDPENGSAFAAGVRRLFTPAWGVEGRVVFSSHALSGENGPYGVELTYTSLLPPDYQPRPARHAATTAWPDTEGTLDRWLASAKLVGRARRGPVAVTAGAGVSWQRVSGEVEPLGYTAFALGGHSVLFVSDYRLVADVHGTSAFGGTGAVDVSVDLGPHMAAMVGYQGFVGPDLRPEVRVRDVLESTPIALAPLDQVRRNLTDGPVRVPFSTSVLVFGVVFH